jgi:hypothetical protein
MRLLIDDLDELEFFDSARVRRLYEKQRRKEARFGYGASSGPKHKRRNEDYEDYEDFDEDYEDYEDYEEYDDYDENEFDSYARVDYTD